MAKKDDVTEQTSGGIDHEHCFWRGPYGPWPDTPWSVVRETGPKQRRYDAEVLRDVARLLADDAEAASCGDPEARDWYGDEGHALEYAAERLHEAVLELDSMASAWAAAADHAEGGPVHVLRDDVRELSHVAERWSAEDFDAPLDADDIHDAIWAVCCEHGIEFHLFKAERGVRHDVTSSVKLLMESMRSAAWQFECDVRELRDLSEEWLVNATCEYDSLERRSGLHFTTGRVAAEQRRYDAAHLAAFASRLLDDSNE